MCFKREGTGKEEGSMRQAPGSRRCEDRSRVERYSTSQGTPRISESYQELGERHGMRREILLQSLRRNRPC